MSRPRTTSSSTPPKTTEVELALPNQSVANLLVSEATTTGLLQAQAVRQKQVAMSKLGIAQVRKKFQTEIDQLTADHEKADQAVNEANASWDKAVNAYEKQILASSPYSTLADELKKFNIEFSNRAFVRVIAEGKKLVSLRVTYSLVAGEYNTYGSRGAAINLTAEQPETAMPKALSGPYNALETVRKERATLAKKIEQVTLKRDRLWQMEETALLEIDRKTYFDNKESQKDLDDLAKYIEANV